MDVAAEQTAHIIHHRVNKGCGLVCGRHRRNACRHPWRRSPVSITPTSARAAACVEKRTPHRYQV